MNRITARIIADSAIDCCGTRLTTFELEYPRFIHSEFMTHRMLSKNSASSRAIPVKTNIENILKGCAIPIHWGKNQRGMQSLKENNEPVRINNQSFSREEAWNLSMNSAIGYATAFDLAGYHKQIVNRLIEPFQTIKVICSGTEYENFFELRRHPDAQPEMHTLANNMFDAMKLSKPRVIYPQISRNSSCMKWWHLPYLSDEDLEGCENYALTNNNISPEKVAIALATSLCAQVSYRKENRDIQKAIELFEKFSTSKPIHASPFEHIARPIMDIDRNMFDIDQSRYITHRSQNWEYWSGNFKGWVQYRRYIQ